MKQEEVLAFFLKKSNCVCVCRRCQNITKCQLLKKANLTVTLKGKSSVPSAQSAAHPAGTDPSPPPSSPASQLNEGGSIAQPAVSQATQSSAVDNGGCWTPQEFNDVAWGGDEHEMDPTAPPVSYASVVAKHNDSSSKYIVSSSAPSCRLHPPLQGSGSPRQSVICLRAHSWTLLPLISPLPLLP